MLVNLRVDMSIRYKNIRPAVIIEIRKLHPEPEKRNTDRRKSRRPRHIRKSAVMVVVIQIVAVVGKISLHNVRPAIVVIVSRIDAHSGLLASVSAVCHSSLRPDFVKSAMAVIVIKQAWRRIVGHVQIEAAVLVVIEPKHPKSVIAF